jgi:hypothetical protein
MLADAVSRSCVAFRAALVHCGRVRVRSRAALALLDRLAPATILQVTGNLISD